jgi:hypothetical protein
VTILSISRIMDTPMDWE